MILSSACQPWHAAQPDPMPESAATKPSPLPGTILKTVIPTKPSPQTGFCLGQWGKCLCACKRIPA